MVSSQQPKVKRETQVYNGRWWPKSGNALQRSRTEHDRARKGGENRDRLLEEKIREVRMKVAWKWRPWMECPDYIFSNG